MLVSDAASRYGARSAAELRRAARTAFETVYRSHTLLAIFTDYRTWLNIAFMVLVVSPGVAILFCEDRW